MKKIQLHSHYISLIKYNKVVGDRFAALSLRSFDVGPLLDKNKLQVNKSRLVSGNRTWSHSLILGLYRFAALSLRSFDVGPREDKIKLQVNKSGLVQENESRNHGPLLVYHKSHCTTTIKTNSK